VISNFAGVFPMHDFVVACFTRLMYSLVLPHFSSSA
jgi:hypothetical protein